MSNVKILVCCHKKTERIHDDVFPAILLGSDFADDALKAEFADSYWDNMGENIAQLHPYCAELTAIYWMWKNYEKLGNPEYVGLFHYRRFFNFEAELQEPDLWKCAFFDFDERTRNRYGWYEDTIEAFCQGYDLILPKQEQILDPHDWKTPASLETHYKHAHYPEDFDLALKLIREKYPEYTEAVERASSSQYGHFCNMFVMTKEMFFDYAQWLFGIILPLEKLLPVTDTKYDKNGQKRVLGFLGERLFNIWINQQKHKADVKIRETQRLTGYLSMDEQNHFSSTYGLAEFKRVYRRSKTPVIKDENAVETEKAIIHLARTSQAPAVSILVPVYNVEPYLSECIESLIHQTLEDIEIIFVNNQSTDGSLEILMSYYQQDPRIAVIEHKKNEGLPGSRNTALQFVRGKYFTYVDSDDICDLTMVEKLYSKAETLQADIVTCSVIGFFDTLENQYLHRPLEWFDNSDRLLPLAKRPQQLMEPAAWCKLFRTSYIQGLDYFEFRYGVIAWEDVPAITSAFIQTDKIATVQEALYFYRQRRAGNLSNGMTSRHIKDFITGVKHQQDILEKHHYHNEDVTSYLEEFKYLYTEWMLMKLRAKDIPYLFHHAGNILKHQDRKYLNRLFCYYPQRKYVYFCLMLRSSFLYLLGRTGYRMGKRIKSGLRRILAIQRDGCYRTFKIGPFRFKQFRKKYSNETIAWLTSRVQDYQAAAGAVNNQIGKLQKEKSALEQAKRLLEDSQEKLLADNTALQEQFSQLKEAHTSLLDQNSLLSKENAQLSVRSEAAEKNSELLSHLNEVLDSSNRVLQQYNATLEKTNSELHSSVDAQSQQIASLSSVVETYQKETAGFYRAVWTTGWIGIWKQYYYENFKQIPQKLERLKLHLDEQSQAMADRLCYRNFVLLPKQEEAALFLYDHWHIYTAEELEGAKQPLEEAELRKQFCLADDVLLETPVFRFHCGLKLLPQEALRQIAGRDVIDGGAYWGDSALVLQDYSPRGIYAFEPQPDNYAKLLDTIKNNHMEDEVHPVQYGVGLCSEARKLYTNGMLSGSSLTNVTPVSKQEETVVNDIQVRSIDDFVEEHNLDVGLIKLDVEGNEFAAIQGAVKTIRKHRPVLSIAIYHNPNDFFEIKPYIESLNLGYRFMVRKLVYHDLVTEVVLLGYSDQRGDTVL